MRKLRIVILDESAFFRAWLKRLINSIPGVRIIGESRDALGALRFLRRVKPDAVILDAKTQREFGSDILRSIRLLTPLTKVIMLTSKAFAGHHQRTAVKADFLIDKLTEYHMLSELLKRLASAQGG